MAVYPIVFLLKYEIPVQNLPWPSVVMISGRMAIITTIISITF